MLSQQEEMIIKEKMSSKEIIATSNSMENQLISEMMAFLGDSSEKMTKLCQEKERCFDYVNEWL